MHTFLKVPTSSSVKCAIAQLYPANWLFSHPALPVLMNVDVVADSASGLGRPLQPCTARWSVCGVYYCRTGSVLYTFSSNTTRVSSSVHGDMGTQKLLVSQFITIYCETPAENCQIGWDHQFDFLWHSNNLFWNKIQQKKNTWTRIFSALNSCQIHKYLCITCDEILYLYYITAIIFLIRLHTL